MTGRITRRDFMSVSAIAGASVVVGGASAFGAKCDPGFKTKLHKAMISGIPSQKQAETLKAAGIEGIECNAWNVTPEKAEEARKVAEKPNRYR